MTAKEYYVVGQVLNVFRSILTNFIHPEIPILIPATWLQEHIYYQGVKYLPNNDGEKAVWQNQWFNYHYTKRGRRALFAVNWESSPETIRLLDNWWHCLQIMATKPFAHRKMEINHYYCDFPSLAMAYSLEKGFYSGKILGSAHELAKIPEYVDRSRKLSGWLLDLREKWKTSQDMMLFLGD